MTRRVVVTGDESGRSPEPGEFAESEPTRTRRIAAFGVASAVLFGVGLVVSESVGEVALDVDLKPFFLPYLLIVVARYGLPTLSIGLGAATAEGFLDVFEGYELDDPVGFLGYVIGFTAFGWYLDKVAADPGSARSLAVGAILGALVQASFEGVAFFLFGPDVGLSDPVVSVVGNTVTHGVLLGAVPLVALRRAFADRFEFRPE